jgi:hypothetical protein
MELGEIIGPWILLIGLAIPLIYAEKLIHQHIYGVGYLMTQDKERATTFYYLVFFPGVFLHEFLQYLAAGALNVKIKKLAPRPQKQDNGTLRFDFVTIEKTDKFRAAIIGGVPFIVAAILVWTISTSILELHRLPEALATGQITHIADTMKDLPNTPDFWLWIYLLFTISNGMLPTKEDRQGWSFILYALAGATGFFLFLGMDTFLLEVYRTTVIEGLSLVNTALSIILIIDVMVILLVGIAEDTLERVRGFKMDYSGGEKKLKTVKREPGSDLPLPKGEPMPSIYNHRLPLPDLPPLGRVRSPLTPPSPEEVKPAGVATPPAPSRTSSAPSPSRPVAAPMPPATPVTEVVPDPDAALRAQMDPRIPRTSGDSPFKRSNLPDETGNPPDPSSRPFAQPPISEDTQQLGKTQSLRPLPFASPAPDPTEHAQPTGRFQPAEDSGVAGRRTFRPAPKPSGTEEDSSSSSTSENPAP